MSTEEFDNSLTVNDENGNPVKIYVLDIVDRKVSLFKKRSFIIYTREDEPDNLYASILNEKATSYSLDTITDPKDMEFINREIDQVVNSEE